MVHTEEITMRAALAAAALAALLSLPLPPAAAASGGTQVVRGRLLPTDDGSDATGKFAVAVTTRGERVKEALAVDAWGLDATKGDGGNLPSYRVFLVSADGETEADFGEAFLSARGRAKLRFSSARQDYPENADPLADFAGGRVEVRLEGDVVLEGDIPDFLGIDDENGAPAPPPAPGPRRASATPATRRTPRGSSGASTRASPAARSKPSTSSASPSATPATRSPPSPSTTKGTRRNSAP
ncbi:MAG: hypothetical protein HUU06_13550 [Planctomycetaceae bacterium]|nr:hypothetical protein [Planctomycetaceae bacterium]